MTSLKRLLGSGADKTNVSFFNFRMPLIGTSIFIVTMAINLAHSQEIRGGSAQEAKTDMTHEKTFGKDVEFLRRHIDTIVLQSKTGKALVAVVPAYQGRVMTSSATGINGTSFGWINYRHVESGEITPQINVYGGEERFWLGPEGGQFSIFFKPGAKFEFAQWQTPPAIDTKPFTVVDQNQREVSFRNEASLQNYSNTNFKIQIDRSVKVLSASEAVESLGNVVSQQEFVGYRTVNRITNVGDNDWAPETGLLSIWLLGMYKPGPQTTVVIPFRSGSVGELGPIVNDAYFGKVPADRLKIQDNVIFFSGNGTYRSKIGVSPQRSTGICGSYDDQRDVLTIVKYNQPGRDVTDYVNSMWELQDKPYSGDAVNAYNDGPPEPGAKPLGPFYELETSSPALALKAGKSGEHIQETYHFTGSAEQLDRLAKQLLGVGLNTIQSALK